MQTYDQYDVKMLFHKPFFLFPPLMNVHLVQALPARAPCYPMAVKKANKHNYRWLNGQERFQMGVLQ